MDIGLIEIVYIVSMILAPIGISVVLYRFFKLTDKIEKHIKDLESNEKEIKSLKEKNFYERNINWMTVLVTGCLSMSIFLAGCTLQDIKMDVEILTEIRKMKTIFNEDLEKMISNENKLNLDKNNQTEK